MSSGRSRQPFGPTMAAMRFFTAGGTAWCSNRSVSTAASKEGLDMLDHPGRSPRLRRNILFDHLAIAIDQIAFRILDGAVAEIDFLRRIACGQKGQGVFGEELLVKVLIFIHADAQDHQT